jgi:hypothetical protein
VARTTTPAAQETMDTTASTAAASTASSTVEVEGEPVWVRAATVVDLLPGQPCNRRPADVTMALRLARWDWNVGSGSVSGGGSWSGMIPIFPGLDIVVAVPDSGPWGSLHVPDTNAAVGSETAVEVESISGLSFSASTAGWAAALVPQDAFYVRVVVQSTMVKLASGGEYELRTVQLMPVCRPEDFDCYSASPLRRSDISMYRQLA